MPKTSDIESEQFLNQERKRVHKALWVIGAWGDEAMADGVIVEKIDVQFPNKTGGDYRAILKGRDVAGGRWVAFVGGGSLPELMTGIASEGSTRGFKWREDKPWPGNTEKLSKKSDLPF